MIAPVRVYQQCIEVLEHAVARDEMLGRRDTEHYHERKAQLAQLRRDLARRYGAAPVTRTGGRQ